MFPINPDLSTALQTIGTIFVLCLVSTSNLIFTLHLKNRNTHSSLNMDSRTHTSDILIIDRSTQSSRQSPITRKIVWVSTSLSALRNHISPSHSLFSFSLSISIPHFCLRLAGKTKGFFILKTCLKNGPLSTRTSTKSGPSGSPVISVTAISLNQACSASINFSHKN